jgi:endonuclease III
MQAMSKKKQETRNEYQENIIYALDAMNHLYGDFPVTELIYHTPFQLLVSVMLSAQTTDKQVNKVTEQFYGYIRTPQDVCKYSEEEIYELVKGVNYSRTKAKHIYQTAGKLSVIGCQLSDQCSHNHQPPTDNYHIPETI